MSVRDFKVVKVDRKVIGKFIEEHHYSGSINGCMADFCFALYDNDELIGGLFYGRMAMANQWRRFAGSACEVIELRRLVCVDNTPKNTESYFIGSTLRWLRKNTDIRVVVSYADSDYGHTGIVYKASNFILEGVRKGAKVIDFEGKVYHDKAIRTIYNGELKPFARRLKQALEEGTATYRNKKEKYCYVYRFT